jgi:hypothetical protein
MRYRSIVRPGSPTKPVREPRDVLGGACVVMTLAHRSSRFAAHAKGHAPPKMSGVLAFLALTGSLPVPASDSGESEKRYCCTGGEIPRIRVAKLAPFPRTAGGSKRLRRAVLVKVDRLRLGPPTKGQEWQTL